MTKFIASGTILNSRYDFPPDRTITSIHPTPQTPKTRIAPRCRIQLSRHDINLFIDDDSITFYQLKENSEQNRFDIDINAILYYITFKTFINYNIVTFATYTSDEIEKSRLVHEVRFAISKIIEKTRMENQKKYIWYESEPCEIVLQQKSIEDFLDAADGTLLYAISYYLLGSRTQQYFLVEFYKCLETIHNFFGRDKYMEDSLKPYGFRKDEYKKVKKYANDASKPLSIGRHAPQLNVPIKHIDTKWLFDDPKGRSVFDFSQSVCRKMIEAYIQFQLAKKAL